jgi:tRNA/tmRNA/rRNA uracil-C5-methylase (TrmA/RlmC/RlmD family)
VRAIESLAKEAGLPAPRVISGARFGYRQRARLMVRGRAASPKLGLFQEGTHRIADIPRCLVHHPMINQVAAAVRRAIRATGTAPYAERPHKGLLRSVQVVIERARGRAQVVLIGNGEDPAALAPLADALGGELGDALHSLWWNGNPARTNTILGPHWHRFHGPEAICERIGGCDVFFPPGAFGQSHLELADELVARVHGWIPDARRVLELYAGCGPIGLGLLARSREVVFNELSGAALEGLMLGLGARPEAEQARARVVAGEAGEAADAVPGCDVAIADPPRQGLDAALLAALLASPPERFVHVSCDVASFLAQARALQAGSPLRLRELVLYELFPHTRHVESAALFTR